MGSPVAGRTLIRATLPPVMTRMSTWWVTPWGAVSEQFGHYPKSAHVANALGKIVAKNISERVAGKDVVPVLPDNLCYMMVNGDPQEEISVEFEYELDSNGTILQTQIDMDVRTHDLVALDFAWIKGRFDDFLL